MSNDFAGRFHPTNRITDAAEKFRMKIERALETGLGDNGKPFDKERFIQNSFPENDDEVRTYQKYQSVGFASGWLSEDEATWLYQKLGRENPTKAKFDKLPIWERIAIMSVMHEIMNNAR